MVETALISAPSRAGHTIFGRPLLERLVLACQRAGVKRVYIETPAARRDEILQSLGRCGRNGRVAMVESFDELLKEPSDGINPNSPCLAIEGNIVLSKSHLNRILTDCAANPGRLLRLASTDADRGGEITTGPLGAILNRSSAPTVSPDARLKILPFALNGRPEDREEAELRLARALKEETANKDALLARLLDRHLSWRISLRLARTRITPNQVTIANTVLGFICAWMFAIPSYWTRVGASMLFLLSITIDGVDGELARLQMSESDFGGRLDLITDNIVHVAIFAGVYLGCYRASHSAAFLYLLPVFMVAFALAALSTYVAFRVRGPDAQQWLDRVDQVSGRDFAYALVLFALFNRLDYFAWGTALGTYVFAFVLFWLTWRRRRRDGAALSGKPAGGV